MVCSKVLSICASAGHILLMVKAISGYLQRSGAIGILLYLKTDTKRFTDLEDLAGISPTTLSDRLKEGRNLGLITTSIGRDEYERDQRAIHHEYMITDRGLLVLEKMDEFDVIFGYRQLREAEKRLDDGLDKMHDWIANNQDKIASEDETHQQKDKYGNDVTQAPEVGKDYSDMMKNEKLNRD